MTHELSIATRVFSVKILAALYDEDLGIIELLYKVCIIDLIDQHSKHSLKNLNAFLYYLKIYRQVLNDLCNNYLITIKNDTLHLSFDGKAIFEKMQLLPNVDSIRRTCLLTKELYKGNEYKMAYIDRLEEYTNKTFFVGGKR